MHEVWGMAALWLGLALVATLLSIRLRIATALSEIVVGTVAQLLLAAVIGSAVVPTIIANAYFVPKYLLPMPVPSRKTAPAAPGIGANAEG